jgi:hypothetical protein
VPAWRINDYSLDINTVNDKCIRFVMVVGLSANSASCATAAGAQKIYQQTVAGFVGQPLSAVKMPYWWLSGPAKPAQHSSLTNGNELYVYQSKNGSGLCTVSVEVSPTSDVITAAKAEGSGCITPY